MIDGLGLYLAEGRLKGKLHEACSVLVI
jgi:hypothetical protein